MKIDTVQDDTPAFVDPAVPAVPALPPTLDLTTFEVGTPVVVIEPGSKYQGGDRIFDATLTVKARVWAEFKATDPGSWRTWRLRLDTQTDGSGSYHANRFRTLDQERFHIAVSEADRFIRAEGIRLDLGSPWHSQAGSIRLARIIWEAQNQG